MKRKDCGRQERLSWKAPRKGRTPTAALAVAGFVACMALPARAGSVRMWRSAVVVSDAIRVGDVCELTDFHVETRRQLAQQTLAEAPGPGGSRMIHLSEVRAFLTNHGINLYRKSTRLNSSH